MPAFPVRSTFALALAALLAPACAGTPAASPPPPGSLPAQEAWDACLGPPPREHRGWSQQGPDLVGTHVVGSGERAAFVRTFLLDGMTTKEGAPVQQVRVSAAGLAGQVGSAAIAGAGFDGVQVRAVLDCAGGAASRPLTARIAAAYHDPRRPAADAWLYRVEILDADGRAAPACAPDADGETGAVALDGVWDARGRHVARPGALSFACAEAAVAKCVRWGYGPEGDMLAACTRMARADYCGDGESATQKGTDVNLWDREGRVPRGASRDGASFEAAWTEDGAVCSSHARWPKRAHPCAGRGSAGGAARMNEQNLPVCRSQAEAEAIAGPGKALLFNESSVHE
jgi:hypothetical protein